MSIKIQNIKNALIEPDKSIYELLAYSIFQPTEEKVRERWDKYFKDENIYLFLAIKNNIHIGIVVFSIEGEKITIENIGVNPEYRNKGIAKKLIAEIEKYYPEKTIFAETDDDSINFYIKANFEIVEKNKKFNQINRYLCRKILTNLLKVTETIRLK